MEDYKFNDYKFDDKEYMILNEDIFEHKNGMFSMKLRKIGDVDDKVDVVIDLEDNYIHLEGNECDLIVNELKQLIESKKITHD